MSCIEEREKGGCVAQQHRTGGSKGKGTGGTTEEPKPRGHPSSCCRVLQHVITGVRKDDVHIFFRTLALVVAARLWRRLPTCAAVVFGLEEDTWCGWMVME